MPVGGWHFPTTWGRGGGRLTSFQYFHRVLAVQRDVVQTDLAIHTTRLTQAQLGGDHFLMRHERRMVRNLETEQRKLMAMLCALEHRFHVKGGVLS